MAHCGDKLAQTCSPLFVILCKCNISRHMSSSLLIAIQISSICNSVIIDMQQQSWIPNVEYNPQSLNLHKSQTHQSWTRLYICQIILDYTSLSNYTSHFSCYKVYTPTAKLSIGWEGSFCPEKKDFRFGLSVTLTVRYVSYWECCHGFESDDTSVSVVIWVWERWHQIESDDVC